MARATCAICGNPIQWSEKVQCVGSGTLVHYHCAINPPLPLSTLIGTFFTGMPNRNDSDD